LELTLSPIAASSVHWIVDDGAFNPTTNLGSFGNSHFNANGGGQFNALFNGVDRRLELGAKIIF
jgi:hypothetical protein